MNMEVYWKRSELDWRGGPFLCLFFLEKFMWVMVDATNLYYIRRLLIQQWQDYLRQWCVERFSEIFTKKITRKIKYQESRVKSQEGERVSGLQSPGIELYEIRLQNRQWANTKIMLSILISPFQQGSFLWSPRIRLCSYVISRGKKGTVESSKIKTTTMKPTIVLESYWPMNMITISWLVA